MSWIPSGIMRRAASRQFWLFLAVVACVLSTALVQPFRVYRRSDDLVESPARYDDYYNDDVDHDISELSFDQDDDDSRRESLNDHITLLKRGWGHQRRFPWRRLPHDMCYQQRCKSNKDCCYSFNLCDKSAKVCIDCWYGSNCKSEHDCCAKYPYCARVWKKSPRGTRRYIAGGKCVSKL